MIDLLAADAGSPAAESGSRFVFLLAPLILLAVAVGGALVLLLRRRGTAVPAKAPRSWAVAAPIVLGIVGLVALGWLFGAGVGPYEILAILAIGTFWLIFSRRRRRPPAGQAHPQAGEVSQVDDAANVRRGADKLAIALALRELLSEKELADLASVGTNSEDESGGQALVEKLVRAGKLTRYQAAMILQGHAQRLVLGDYVILDRLGAGGMGQVFKARHRRMDRLVAIKIIAPELMKSADAVRRFEREGRAAAKLTHCNIVIAYDAREEGGIHYLVMEYVDGRDLASIVRDRGPLAVPFAVACVLEAARGLEHAHAQGIIHRDIKPGNLLMDREGTVKILDMGLAGFAHGTAAADDATREQLTGAGAVMGTVDYMAPEQAVDAHDADGRSDIYSLGCTLYFLVTGQQMYGGDSVIKKILAHREAPIPSLCDARGGVPPELNALYHRMVAKRPEDRFPTASELVVALEEVLAGAAGMGETTAFAGELLPASPMAQDADDLKSDLWAAPPWGAESAQRAEPLALQRTLPHPERTPDDTVRRRTDEPTEVPSDPQSAGRAAGPSTRQRRLWVAIGLLVLTALAASAFFLKSDLGPQRREDRAGPWLGDSATDVTAAPHRPAPRDGDPIDLLGAIKADAAFEMPKGWQWADGELQSDATVETNNLELRQVTEQAYALDAEFTLRSGNDAIYFVLPLGPDRHCFFGVNTFPKDVKAFTGFGHVAGKTIETGVHRFEHATFRPGERCQVKIEVRVQGGRAKLVGTLNGRPVTYEGPVAELSVPEEYHWHEPDLLGVGTVNSRYTLQALRWSKLADARP